MDLDTAIKTLQNDYRDYLLNPTNPILQAINIALIIMIALQNTLKEMRK